MNKHIKVLIYECIRRTDILKSLASSKWGASTRILRLFYISYIRAKIDYGAILYGNASKTNLDKLEKVQNMCMRVILGAWKTTPILSLQAETNLPPLRRVRVAFFCTSSLVWPDLWSRLD